MVQIITADGMRDTHSWGYRLQGDQDGSGAVLRPADLMTAPHDLLVIDFSADGLDSGRYHAEDIHALQTRRLPGGDRATLIAYISIGEASDDRSHWDKAWTDDGSAAGTPTAAAPSWLGPGNPAWRNSRKVRYWQDGWQRIVFDDDRTGWIDMIAAQGFDGAYLDIVDAYYFWGVEVDPGLRQEGDPADEAEAARRMIDFIAGFTTHVRSRYPDFMILPQNGEMILDALGDPAALPAADATRRKAFLASVSAIGVEDVYCPGNTPENNPLQPAIDRIKVLKRDFRDNGKPVFSVDYLNDDTAVASYLTRCSADGFVPYAAPRRNLDRLGPAFAGEVPVIVASRGLEPPIDPAAAVSPARRRSATAPRWQWRGGRPGIPAT